MSTFINRATSVRIGAILASFLMIALLVVTGSRAAFTATTTNDTNTFTAAGAIAVSTDATGSQLFTVTGLTPGASVENCVAVTFVGDSPNADIRLYAGPSVPASLADVLDIQVSIGTGGGFVATELGGGEGDCTGYLAGSVVSPTAPMLTFLGIQDFASAPVGWTTSIQGNTQTYQITVTMDAAADDSYANTSSGDIQFVWEAQG